MCRLIETIKVLNRQLCNIELHEKRFNSSRVSLFGSERTDLQRQINIPESIDDGLYKCRVIYSDEIHSVEFVKYEKRVIRTLKLIETVSLDYSHKYLNRVAIDELYDLKGGCDDILIVKNGKLTDTSYCNIALSDGKQWYTPALPLLAGTKRAFLLREKTILVKDISVKQIRDYGEACLFNSMIDFGETVLPVESIMD
jgi:4-amino-4-deoxychorismate lyase